MRSTALEKDADTVESVFVRCTASFQRVLQREYGIRLGNLNGEQATGYEPGGSHSQVTVREEKWMEPSAVLAWS